MGRVKPCRAISIPSSNVQELMLKFSILFLLVAIIAGAFGFGGIAGTSAWIAQVLFVIFLILFAVSFLFGRQAPS